MRSLAFLVLWHLISLFLFLYQTASEQTRNILLFCTYAGLRQQPLSRMLRRASVLASLSRVAQKSSRAWRTREVQRFFLRKNHPRSGDMLETAGLIQPHTC